MRPNFPHSMLVFMHSLVIWFRELSLYTSSCDDKPIEKWTGHDDQNFRCIGSGKDWHNVKLKNIAATGHKVILYSDMSCSHEIGRAVKDNRFYSLPSDVSKMLYYCFKVLWGLIYVLDGD